MRILWCHEVDYEDKPVYEYQDFAERLAARGHDVEVIDFREAAATLEATRRISRTGEAHVALTSIPHSGIPGLKYAQARLAFRRMLSDRLKAQSFDAAFVYSIFINGTEAVRLCQKHGVPVVYRVLDAYHRLRPGRLTQALLKNGERYVYENADRVLTTNEEMSSYVSSVANKPVFDRVSVVDHGVDGSHFSPRVRDRELATRYGLDASDTVLLFLGTTYLFSGLTGLIGQLPGLLNRRPNLKLVIVGAGPQDAELVAAVKRLQLERHVVFTGMIAYHDVPRHLSLADVALNPFEINDVTRDIVPIKILQYEAMGLPVISTPLPDVQRKHPTERSGVLYSEDDSSAAFASAVENALERDDLVAVGRRGRGFVEENYTVERAVDQLESTLTTLVAERREPSRA